MIERGTQITGLGVMIGWGSIESNMGDLIIILRMLVAIFSGKQMTN